MTRTVEGARIFQGPHGEPRGWLRRFVGEVSGEAETALDRCKEVLVAVTHAMPGLREPDRPDFWLDHVPQWFLDRCAPSKSQEEAEAELAHWRSLDAAGKARYEQEQAWTFDEWVAWFDWRSDLRRSWLWWDGGTTDAQHFWIEVEVNEDPVAMGTLFWMMRAAGALAVVEESVDGR